MKSARPFLMFQGQAAQALAFYRDVFPEAEVRPQAFGENVTLSVLSLRGQEVLVNDSPPVHGFTFTPSWSFFIECDDEAELERLNGRLAEDGKTMMPPEDYGFSRRFAWVEDRFGVSWQLNLA